MSKSKTGFNLGTYSRLVSLALTRWPFETYDNLESKKRFILWRHDCDMSLNRAVRLAEIDAELGITSTFFLHPRSEFYNLLETRQVLLARRIVELGHRVGLHLDTSAHLHLRSEDDLIKAVLNDAKIVEEVVNSNINVFSFHNPDERTTGFRARYYGDYLNCYSDWMAANVAYGSDSNGYWRHDPLQDTLEKSDADRVQILTHPEWWLSEEVSPRDRVLRAVYGRAIRVMEMYDQALASHPKRENLGWYDGGPPDDLRTAINLINRDL